MITVNADDFGIGASSTFAIVECFKRGWLDTTTAMMNMPECVEAQDVAQEESVADRVGIHINLTWGMPLTDRIRKRPLFCDCNGNFSGRFHACLTSRLWLGTDDQFAVAEEVRAQFAAFAKSGFMWRHVDSHHHVHMDASILPIVLAIACENGFRSIRIGRNVGQGMSSLNRLYKGFVNSKVRRSGVAYTDYFGSPYDATVDRSWRDHSIELMTHPTYRTSEGERCRVGKLCDFKTPIEEIEKLLDGIRHPGI